MFSLGLYFFFAVLISQSYVIHEFNSLLVHEERAYQLKRLREKKRRLLSRKLGHQSALGMYFENRWPCENQIEIRFFRRYKN